MRLHERSHWRALSLGRQCASFLSRRSGADDDDDVAVTLESTVAKRSLWRKKWNTRFLRLRGQELCCTTLALPLPRSRMRNHVASGSWTIARL